MIYRFHVMRSVNNFQEIQSIFSYRLPFCSPVSCRPLHLSSRKPIKPPKRFWYLSILDYKANQQRWKPRAETCACPMSTSLAKLNRFWVRNALECEKGMLGILTGSTHRLTRFSAFGLSNFFTTKTSVIILDGN